MVWFMPAGVAVSRLAHVICIVGVFYVREGRLRLGGWLYRPVKSSSGKRAGKMRSSP